MAYLVRKPGSTISATRIMDFIANQSEGSLAALLQRRVVMNIILKALKETDIGRQVTRLRKHSSDEVHRLVKILVRKWKDTVD
ncbi:probable mediator of RNA polymerase II transcription subunit 26b isoform X4 [Henckelia pumila]|uniref:probable mediator of RNA polymerase II transcription subunit 26b isoform X4 n=1 Tax=Henckelia pumila TaxID=405737 RepID=UPI003C6E4DA7